MSIHTNTNLQTQYPFQHPQGNSNSLLDELIKNVEQSNYSLGRIQNLNVSRQMGQNIFNSQFNYQHFDNLASKINSLPLKTTKIQKLSQTQLLSSFGLLEKVLWYYNDHIYNSRYKIKNLYVLISLFFNHLKDKDLKLLINKYNNLSQEIPVAGAILISKYPYQTLLVKNNLCQTWSYPKGKMTHDETETNGDLQFTESPESTAIRETFEETGYDISSGINNMNVIVKKCRKKTAYFYVIFDVPLDYPFKPANQHEIIEILWKPVEPSLGSSREFNIYINHTYNELINLIGGGHPTFLNVN